MLREVKKNQMSAYNFYDFTSNEWYTYTGKMWEMTDDMARRFLPLWVIPVYERLLSDGHVVPLAFMLAYSHSGRIVIVP